MSVSVTLAETLTIAEVLTGNTVGVANNSQKTVTHSNFNLSATLNSGSTPAATGCAVFTQSLTNGAATIDFTAMTGTNGLAISANGTKIVAAMFKAADTNGSAISISAGASNGYELLGNGFTCALKANQQALFYLDSGAPTVGSGAKTIDLAGSGAESISCVIVFG